MATNQELFNNQFETHLYNFIENYIIEPSVPKQDELHKYCFGSKKELTDFLRRQLDNIEKSDSMEQVKNIEIVFTHLYANRNYEFIQTGKFSDITKLKMFELYFREYNCKYKTSYLQSFFRTYHELIFNQSFNQYVINTYTNIDNTTETKIKSLLLRPGIKKNVEKYLSNCSNIHNNTPKKNGFITWSQADKLHEKIMNTIKQKSIQKSKDDLIEETMGKIMHLTNRNLYTDQKLDDVDQLGKLIKQLSSKYPNEYNSVFLSSENATNLKLGLYSELYVTSPENHEFLKRLYMVIFSSPLDFDVELFRYFLANKVKFDDTIRKNVECYVYDYLTRNAKSNYKFDETKDNINKIKLKMYINYYFGEFNEQEKELYQTYHIALFDKPIEFDVEMAQYFSANSDNFESVIKNDQFKDIVIQKLLTTY